jgi:hypothetical protein
MKKVAIVLSGHVRTFHECWSSWNNNVVQPNQWNCDYYVHTYKHAQRTDPSKYHDKIFTPDDELASEIRVHRAIEMLEPIKCVIDENYPDVKSHYEQLKNVSLYRGREDLALSQLLMTYKMKKAYELLEPSINNYDMIVRSRFDLMWPNPIIFNEIKEKDIVYDIRSPSDAAHNDAACDLFGILHPTNANKYFSLYDTLVTRAKRGMRKYNLEIHLGMHLREQQFNLRPCKFNGMHIKRF